MQHAVAEAVRSKDPRELRDKTATFPLPGGERTIQPWRERAIRALASDAAE